MQMKKSYVEPIILVEDFCLNENIAVCDIVIDAELLPWMPNLNDLGPCDTTCPNLMIDAWMGTLLS